MADLLARPVATAFLEVAVLVAVTIGLFAWLQHRLGDRLTRFLLAHQRFGPLLGAALGVVPGCGGAIIVMPLYVRGQVSFGAVVAALVATMGDSSFVLIAADPLLAAVVHASLFAGGIVSGYLVDAVGFAPRARRERGAGDAAAALGRAGQPVGAVTSVTHAYAGGDLPVDGSVSAGGVVALTRVTPLPRWLYAPLSVGAAPALFWSAVLAGAVVVTPVLLQITDDASLPRLFGIVDPFLTVGLAGAVAAAVVAATARREQRGGRAVSRGPLAEILHQTAIESARITLWVAVAFLFVELAAELGFTVVAVASAAGLAGVLAGSLIGLIPGCAPQIVLTGLYASGGIPLPTLLANAFSQDGDALLPMLLMDRRAAVVASVVTTVPGLVAGAVALLVLRGG